MRELLTIVVMGIGMFGLRCSGFVAPIDALPDRGRRALRVLPIALLAALIASSTAGPASGDPARVLAMIVAALVAWRRRQVWMVIAAGLGTFWLCAWSGPGG